MPETTAQPSQIKKQAAQEKKLFSQYKDVTGQFSNVELQAATWYVKYKYILRQIFKILLIVFCIITMGLALWGWGDYLIFGLRQDSQMETALVTVPDFTISHNQYGALPLQPGQTRVFQSEEGIYNFVTMARNNNDRFIAEVEYVFQTTGGVTETSTALLWPASEVPIIFYGYKSNSFPSNVRFEIKNIRWKRLDARMIPDSSEFINAHWDVSVENVQFSPATAATERATHQITFDLTNNSAYSYWEVTAHVALLNGNSVVGYLPLVVDQFRAAETRSIDLRTTIQPLTVTDIRIIPTHNIFESDAYMAPGQ